MTTVLWDHDESDGLVLELEERMQESLRAIEILRQASTVGELRRNDLPAWAEQVVEGRVESLRDEDVDDIDGAEWDWSEDSEAVIDVVPLPWDAASVTQWLDKDLLTKHAELGGASPGGHIDSYRVDDHQALLDDLELHGYTLERRPGLREAFYRAL
jgi:hypothetical protein